MKDGEDKRRTMIEPARSGFSGVGLFELFPSTEKKHVKIICSAGARQGLTAIKHMWVPYATCYRVGTVPKPRLV